MKRVVIVGGGMGGTLLANLLARELHERIREGTVTIQVVGDTRRHVFQPGNLAIAFRGAPMDAFTRDEAPLLREGVTFIAENAARIDLAARTVALADGRILPYDQLVLATGAVPHLEAIPGLAEGALNFHTGPEDSARIWHALRDFAGGDVVVAIASVPYKCPPAPNEAVFLLDEHFRRRKMRDKVRIKLLTPYPRAYPAEAVSKAIEPLYAARGIEVVPFFAMDHVDPARRVVASIEGDEVPYDVLIAIPPHRGADVVLASGIGDEEGWIPTDKETMRVVGHDDAYAVGDATAIPISKSGVVAHLQATSVARNVLAALDERRDVEWTYNGCISCPMETGKGKALFVSATYAEAPRAPRVNRTTYAIKRGVAAAYWMMLTGGLEWAMRIYFGNLTSRQRARTASIAATRPTVATPSEATPPRP